MTSIDLHNKYFSLISSKISLEHMEEYADKLDEDIFLLIGSKDTSEDWVRECEKIIASSVPFPLSDIQQRNAPALPDKLSVRNQPR